MPARRKPSFAGGDVKMMIQARPEDAAAAQHRRDHKGQLRSLETLGKPVVRPSTVALGGGLRRAGVSSPWIAADASRAASLVCRR